MKKIFRPDFLIIPYELFDCEKLDKLDRIIYGVIYWYEKLKDGECRASNQSISEIAKCSVTSVSGSLKRLQENGFIKCIYEDEKKFIRSKIKTFVSYKKTSFEMKGVSLGTGEGQSGDWGGGQSGDLQISNIQISNRIRNEQEVVKTTSTPSKKNFKIVNNNTKSSNITSSEKINIIYNLFKEYNFETELWGNRKQNREAAITLYEKKGLEKVKNILKFYKNEFKGTTVIGNTYDLVNKYDIIKKEFTK